MREMWREQGHSCPRMMVCNETGFSHGPLTFSRAQICGCPRVGVPTDRPPFVGWRSGFSDLGINEPHSAHSKRSNPLAAAERSPTS
jgi:hypothetical protein